MKIGQRVLARLAVGMSDLRRSASSIIEGAHGLPVAVLNNGRIRAYLVPAATYERMRDQVKASDKAN